MPFSFFSTRKNLRPFFYERRVRLSHHHDLSLYVVSLPSSRMQPDLFSTCYLPLLFPLGIFGFMGGKEGAGALPPGAGVGALLPVPGLGAKKGGSFFLLAMNILL
jgi:hypothetical protein